MKITKEFLDSISDEEIKLIKGFFERIYKRKTSGRKQVIETTDVLKEWNAGKTRREISDTLGVSYPSVCRIIKDNNE